MANRSQESARQSQKTRRMLLTAVGTVGVVYLLFSFFLGDMGLVQSFKIGRAKRDLEREIFQLRQQNEQLRQEVERLRSDPEMIEQLARDRLGLVRKGERVYRFRETPGNETPSPGPRGGLPSE